MLFRYIALAMLITYIQMYQDANIPLDEGKLLNFAVKSMRAAGGKFDMEEMRRLEEYAPGGWMHPQVQNLLQTARAIVEQF